MDAPRRPWWLRTRWIAAGLLWLAVAYPVSLGPLVYATYRGWLPLGVYATAAAPLRVTVRDTPLDGVRSRYIQWWLIRGVNDANGHPTH